MRPILHMMRFLLAGVAMALISSQPLAHPPASRSAPTAQPAADPSLGTETGHEVNVSVGGYDYVEPDGQRISIHGPKFGGEYTGTMSIGKRQHWFAKAGVRGTV